MEALDRELDVIVDRIDELDVEIDQQSFYTRVFRGQPAVFQASKFLELTLERERDRLLEKMNDIVEKMREREEMRAQNVGRNIPRPLQDVTMSIDIQRNRQQ